MAHDAGRKRLREAAVVAVVAADRHHRAARQRAKHPGELSALDRGILRIVSPGQSAMSYLARGITGVARPLRRAQGRARRERGAVPREPPAAHRADGDAPPGRGERALPAPAGAARRDARGDDRGARDRHRRVAVLPRRARRHRSRRGDGQARHARADARGRGRPDQPRRGQELGRDAAGRPAFGAGRADPAHRRPRHPARQGGRERLPLQHRVPGARRAGARKATRS